jgi:hypothetical protein
MSLNWPNTLSLSTLDKLRIESAVDQSLRDRLLKDPAAVLAENGITVPPGVKVNAVADTADTHTLTLPPFVGTDLSNKSLGSATAAASTWECTTCTPTSPICAGSLASLTCVGNK